jgi:ubiquinone/menaquinone biosynthesis C-methylase UbiE
MKARVNDWTSSVRARIGSTILPTINDAFLGSRMEAFRADVLRDLRGEVLEVGAGSGLNFAHYGPGVIVTAIEPDAGMRMRAHKRLDQSGSMARITVEDARADQLPYDSGRFDAVVFTFVLCSIRDIDRALKESRRVLRSGGRLSVLEHVIDPDPSIARWQRRVQPVWGVALAGCHLTRDIRTMLDRTGFDVQGISATVLPLPWITRSGISGTAY